MTIKEQIVPYRDGDITCEGFFCYDPNRAGPLPAVMISHDWSGRGEFVARKARRLAWHGFAAFALDMYGGGKQGKSVEENQALMNPLASNRALLAQRITAALTAVRGLPQVDAKRIAAMGFCFGGLCVLDLARTGADVRGVASFHGLLKPSGLPAKPIKAKVLAMHGYDDPMAPPEDVLAFGKEFTAAGADWQLHAYGKTKHAFTNPEANNPQMGLLYNADADRRSWHAMLNFFEEVLR
ncbi:MAG TPA: dienelactone hydrolase family protein [Steroidobacteraceae bacterium]|nr:dienelactone hydrolase family protein [Steroidobacteraceae bacterium]